MTKQDIKGLTIDDLINNIISLVEHKTILKEYENVDSTTLQDDINIVKQEILKRMGSNLNN